jgi:hypothetical protein
MLSVHWADAGVAAENSAPNTNANTINGVFPEIEFMLLLLGL